MDKIIEAIEVKLKEIESDINALSEKELKYLIEIESVIKDKEEVKQRLLMQLKENGYSLLSISKIANISRQTMYNNPILKSYIQYSIDIYNKDNPDKVIDKLKDAISSISQENMKMKYRDLDIELLRHDIENLKKSLKKKSVENANLKKRNISLIKEIATVKNKYKEV